MKFLSLYVYSAKQTIREELVHRASFLTGVVGQWLYYGGTCLTLYILVTTFGSLGGWNASEIAFLFAFTLLTYALAATVFFNPCRNLADKIRSGDFDGALVRPVDPLLFEISQGFNFGYIGHILLSSAILILCAPRTAFSCTLPGILLFLLMLASAVLLQTALLLFASTFSFFTVGDNPLLFLLTHNLKQFVDYPLSIYSTAIQTVLTFVLPYGFLNFYPAGVVLQKQGTFVYPGLCSVLPPFVSLSAFLLSVYLWKRSLKHYQSTGS